MRDSVVGTSLPSNQPFRPFNFTAIIPFNILTEETGQHALTFLLELMAGADTSQVLAAAKPPLADPAYQIHEGKLMVTAQLMRPVKEII